MAAGRHLGFSTFRTSDEIFQFLLCKVYAVQISAKSSIHAEVINILVNPRWRPPPSWIFKFRTSDEIFQFLLCQGICSSNFSQKAQSMRKLLTILVYPRWRPAAILDFQHFALLMKFSNSCYAKVYAVQISAKKLNPCGSY